jgi:plasminogen activator inhibitor 1 RNA-binding protein
MNRRRPNNDRNTKFGRGGRAPVRDGKRAYDRRSGTGRGKEIKKGGGGARNWGSDKNEARQAQGNVADEAEAAPPVEVSEREPEEAEAAPVEEEEPVKEEEPEDTTLSYEEYLERKKQQQAESALFAPVQERQVENEFANLKPKEAVKEDFFVMGGGKQKKVKNKTKEVQAVEVGFRVEPNVGGRGRGGGRGRSGDREWRDSGRGGGERGGRGTGRGGGRGGGRSDSGRGGGRSDSGRGRGRGGRGGGGLNVNDAQAFPSL